MDFSALLAFVTIAECGSFTQAARRIHITQPALSRRIKALEEKLGAHVFDRTTRRVELTATGLEIFDPARMVLAAAGALDERITQARRGRPVRIGVAEYTAGSQIRLHVADRLSGGKTEVQMHSASDRAIIAGLRSGEFDLGVLLGPLDGPEFDELETGSLADNYLVAMIPDDDPIAAREALQLEDFAGRTIISLREDIFVAGVVRDLHRDMKHAGATMIDYPEPNVDFVAQFAQQRRCLMHIANGVAMPFPGYVCRPILPHININLTIARRRADLQPGTIACWQAIGEVARGFPNVQKPCRALN